MIRIFIDTSVLFAACFSSRGASYAILQHGIREFIEIVVSDIVLEEVERNLSQKAPQALPAYDRFRSAIPLTIVRSTQRDLQGAARYVALKDAPIIAAAKAADVDHLVSLDRRHIVGIDHVQRRSGLRIVLPEECLAVIRTHKRAA